MPFKVGDKVIIRGELNPLTIKEVVDHPNFKVGPNVYTVQRLYFVEKHQPEWDWRATHVENTEEKGEENE